MRRIASILGSLAIGPVMAAAGIAGHDRALTVAGAILFGTASVLWLFVWGSGRGAGRSPRRTGPFARLLRSATPERRLDAPVARLLKLRMLAELDKTGPWAVAGMAGDPESCRFADEIRAFMAFSGFRMAPDGLSVILPPSPVVGLAIVPPDPGSEPHGQCWYFVVGEKPGPDRILRHMALRLLKP